ncbi:MAG: hypothetical protein NT166_13140 [Candidatus Aminicenantes bacterium]|nr:hypothetical protein [Candidatus Aminicenantes bacterium]
MDIKLPLGLIFTIIGLLLVGSGLVHAEEVVQKLQFNFNLWWGAVVGLFGLFMLGLHFKKSLKRSH